MTVLLAQPFGAQPEIAPKTLARGDQFGGAGQGLGRAKPHLETPGVFLGQRANFEEFHRGRHGRAERDWVVAIFVAQKIRIGQCIEVVDTGIRPQRPGCLKLQSAARAHVLRLVDDGVVLGIDGRNAAAGDGACEAGRVRREVRLAVTLTWNVHGFGGNPIGPLELHLAHVAGRHRADFVNDIHQHLRAHFRQAFAGHRIAGQHAFTGLGRFHELFRIADIAHALSAAHGDGFEILGGHDGPHS